MAIDGSVDSNLMFTTSFEEDHSNHTNSYVEIPFFLSVFVDNHGEQRK